MQYDVADLELQASKSALKLAKGAKPLGNAEGGTPDLQAKVQTSENVKTVTSPTMST